MNEILNMTPTYLAALSGAALLLLGFLAPKKFAGIEVEWTRLKSLGCIVAGLLLLSYVVIPALTNKVLVDQSAIGQLKSETQQGIDAITRARGENSYPGCFDKASVGLKPLNDAIATLNKIMATK
jgi:hypothetical protein